MPERRPSMLIRWLAGVVLAGLLLRLLRYGLHFELFVDEAFLVTNAMERGYRQLLGEPLAHGQVAPPLFLWITRWCDAVGGDEWTLRLPSLLAGLGSVLLFARISRLLLRGSERWLALAVFSMAHVPILQSSRVKPYSLDLFLATLLTYLGVCLLLKPARGRPLAWLCVVAPLALWFSYTTAFVSAALALLVAAGPSVARGSPRLCPEPGLPRASRDPGVAGLGALSGRAVFPALLVASGLALYVVNILPTFGNTHTMSGMKEFWASGFPPGNPLLWPRWLLQAQTGRGFAWPVGDHHFASTGTFVLWAMGVGAFWRRYDRRVLALLLLPQALLLAAAFSRVYPYGGNLRLILFLGPNLAIFMAVGACWLSRRFGHRGRHATMRIFTGCLVAVGLGQLGLDLHARTRELANPGLRAVISAAARTAGPDASALALGPTRILQGGETRQVFEYYARRALPAGAVRWDALARPPDLAPGSRVIVMDLTEKPGAGESRRFGDFERASARALKEVWRAVGTIQPEHNGRLEVRVYQVGP
jgi:hypothetical protein